MRNWQHPLGFPWLAGAQLKEAEQSNSLVTATIEMAHAAHAVAAKYLIEFPEDLGLTPEGDKPASIWQLAQLRTLAEDTQAWTVAVAFFHGPQGR